MHKNQNNLQILQSGNQPPVQSVLETYVIPDIEVIDIEIQMNILEGSGDVPVLPGEGLD